MTIINKSDIKKIPIPKDIFEEFQEKAQKLMIENKGFKTRNGGDQRDIKGSLGQWAVHNFLDFHQRDFYMHLI